MHAIVNHTSMRVLSPPSRSIWPTRKQPSCKPLPRFRPPFFTPTGFKGVAVALLPCLFGTLAAAHMNPADWCFGEARTSLAVCLSGAVAAGTLLLCWHLFPKRIQPSAALAVAAGLGAAMPLLLG